MPMARHQPVEPSARATSSITCSVVRMSAPRPPSASGSATLNSRASASSMHEVGRQLAGGLDLGGPGADARRQRAGNVEGGGGGPRGGSMVMAESPPSCARGGRPVKTRGARRGLGHD